MKNISDEKVDLPDGKYDAIWGGYKLVIPRSDKSIITVNTNVGIRTPRMAIVVEIKDGTVNTLSVNEKHREADRESNSKATEDNENEVS